MAADSEPMLDLQNVTFAYPGAKAALDSVCFRVQKGEFLGLIGPNGGGKTTLLKLILGALVPDAGTVRVFGREASQLGRDRRLLGYVPQDTNIRREFPATVFDVALMGATASLGPLRRPGSAEREAAREALARVGLDGLRDRPSGHLSGGQQQRLAIARALVAKPPLLLLDEPTNGLDTGGQARLFATLRELRAHYTLTVVMVSHDVTALAHYAGQIACLNKTLHWHGQSELLSEDTLRTVYACELKAYFLNKDRPPESVPSIKDSPCCGHGPVGAVAPTPVARPTESVRAGDVA